MKKIIITSLFCATALFVSACSDDGAKKETKDDTNKILNTKLNTDTFKIDIQNEEIITNPLFDERGIRTILNVTAKDDIEITKITANRGNCGVYDLNLNSINMNTTLISSDIPPIVCYNETTDHLLCFNLPKWLEKGGNCLYKVDGEKLELADDKLYTKNCEKSKKIANEKYSGKYFYTYKLPMKFGETSKFKITKCSDILEISIFTNKGVATYSLD